MKETHLRDWIRYNAPFLLLILLSAALMIWASPALAGGDDHPKPPPQVCSECPSVGQFLRGSGSELDDCRVLERACGRVASASYRCQVAVQQALFKNADARCEDRECRGEARDFWREIRSVLRAQKRDDRDVCSRLCD